MSLLRRATVLAMVATAALVVRPAAAHAIPVCDVPNPPPVCGPDVPDPAGTISNFSTNKQPGDPYSRVSFTYGATGATSTRVYTRHGWGTAGLPWTHMNTFSGGAVKTTPGYWYYSGEKVEFQIRSYVGSTQKDSVTVCVALCSLN
ncbi:hypothetical protein ACFPIJ_39395 [Dactylosporangium cerinum]|uniref:Secreted protein n=1 Tax=Dactylosporangium cerinum TaxID=1434730 RepID=A0ABV9W8G7_9ACTN